jgi:hypothetical protein
MDKNEDCNINHRDSWVDQPDFGTFLTNTRNYLQTKTYAK